MFSTDPLESAAEAGLRYIRSEGPGIRRIRCGKGFRYVGPDGQPLIGEKRLTRIRSLVIPPAWQNVWICPLATGHLQATGVDARGRKQYRYHPQYRSTRDQAKFSRMPAFGADLAVIRKRVQEDLERRGLPKKKVLAAIVRLLETTYIRVGNDEYAKENDSFGLTTMRNRHAYIDGYTLQFRFRGKSGLDHVVQLTDRRLARIVKACQELPGYELFEYINEDGEACRIDSADVNRYIREISGQDFTAKDFRTWFGSLLAAKELYGMGPARTATAARKNVVEGIKRVAKKLRNRASTCRKYYIHPAVLESYSNGSLFETMRRGEEQHEAYDGQGLRPEEYAVLVIITQYQQNLARAA